MGLIKDEYLNKDYVYDEEIQESILTNNYYVVRYFDDIREAIVSSKFLSRSSGDSLIRSYPDKYLISYKLEEHFSILGVVPMNSYHAFIFNKAIPVGKFSNSDNCISITYGVHDDLLRCYVFRSVTIDYKFLSSLLEDYFSRGGIIFSEYHSYEKLVLYRIRDFENSRFRHEIIFENIFKHGFREVGRDKWSNGFGVDISRVNISYGSLKYPSLSGDHINLDLPFNARILLGSIFAKYYSEINQISSTEVNVICRRDYLFCSFIINFKKD